MTARHAILLHLLEDWEAGRCTAGGEYLPRTWKRLFAAGHVMPVAWAEGGIRWTLTPAGLAAARQAQKGEG